jgi:acetyl esterase/lipase
MLSAMKPARIFLLAAVASITLPVSAADSRINFSAEGDFSETAIRRGVKATQEQCEKVDNAVWVSTKDHGEECLKYWAAGFPNEPTERAVVYFHGDIWVGAGKTSKDYLQTTNRTIQRDAEAWSKRLAAPYIFFGRPGTFGSSGDHMQRRRVSESILISAALEKIKERLKIKEFVVTGQSGGGHVTSSLITYRADIVCAVPTSAPSSPRVRWTLKGLTKDTTGYRDSYEPTEHLRKDKVHAMLRVFVLGNPDETNVVWPSQVVMAAKLKDAGIPVETLHGKGTGPDGHGLSNSARIVAGWCFKDLPTQEIMRKAAEGLRG